MLGLFVAVLYLEINSKQFYVKCISNSSIMVLFIIYINMHYLFLNLVLDDK